MLKRILIVWIVYAGVMGFAIGGSFVAAYQTTLPQHETSADSEQRATNQNAKEKSEDALARYTFWLTIFTGVMAFATVGLGIATIGLYATGEKQIEVALKAANAADLNARAAIAIELPILRAEADRFSFGSKREGDGPQIEYCFVALLNIVNIGRTKTFPIEVRYGWTFGKNLPSVPVYAFTKAFKIDTIIGQGDLGFANLDEAFEFEQGIKPYDLVRTAKAGLWFYCCIAYLDFMQNRHEAGFCWRRHEGMSGGFFLVDSTPAYNRKT